MLSSTPSTSPRFLQLLRFLVAYFLLPNLPFWLASRFLGISRRGYIDIDYAVWGRLCRIFDCYRNNSLNGRLPHPFPVLCEKVGDLDHRCNLWTRALQGSARSPTRETTVESHPSKNEGWGIRHPALGLKLITDRTAPEMQ
jgi:hypothetical protein